MSDDEAPRKRARGGRAAFGASSDEELPPLPKPRGASQYDAVDQFRKHGAQQMDAARHARHRVYVGNIDLMIVEQDIHHLFSNFGNVVNVHMPRDGARSQGFCFVEYDNKPSADLAIARMQNFMLGGRHLRVNQPTEQRRPLHALGTQSTGVSGVLTLGPPGSAAGAAANTAAIGESTLQAAGGVAVPRPVINSKTVCLENMVGPGELDEDLADEVKEECESVGPVTKVRVEEVGAEKHVRVFVTFKETEGCAKTVAKMNGRFFGGRKVKATAVEVDAL